MIARPPQFDCAPLQLGAHQDIILHGDPPDDVHLVLEGVAIRYKGSPDGRRQIVALLLPGDFCDLHVAILGAMDHSIATVTPCTIVDISTAAISDITRSYAEIQHKAGSWSCERRAVARIEATRLGLDIRFVVTNVTEGTPAWIYETLYCARGQAENLIKLHKAQLRSDRTSCRSALANQMRLVLHTAAYWLMLTVRDAIPTLRDLARAEFAPLRLRLLKVAARITEARHRVRLAFAVACPEAALIAGLPAALLRPRI